MDEIEDEYGPDATLVDALIAVEITHMEDDQEFCTVEGRILSQRTTVGIGLANRMLDALSQPSTEDD